MPNSTILQASLVILLILSANAIEAKSSTTYGGRKTMQKKIDSELIKQALVDYHLSAMKHGRVMAGVRRISPSGPDPIHDNTPPKRLP
ncbi:hypothetical protein COLO4_31342 [Corchorus olitorius]|uniref:Uncharacterized protein n=1 Tax=Corchorus olitorius TaxID=93759 RepID=A0A1R3H4P3_9ROSI|nr:hypothetical protein COLO4_31342 [Corchorus olitorius]